MAWLPKNNLNKMKDKLSKAMDDVSEKAKSIDFREAAESVKSNVGSAAGKAKSRLSDIDYREKSEAIKSGLSSAADKAKESASAAYSVTAEKSSAFYQDVSERLSEVDYENFKNVEYYKETFTRYKDMSSSRVSEYFNATFEVDKDTMDVVDGLRGQLPVPAKKLEDIFDQCKQEAIRRTIASFCLSGVMNDIDNHSAAKYENLSESYKDFSDRTGYAMFDDPNFAEMKNQRYEAKERWTMLEDGYSKDTPLDPRNADIEHVVARKDYYNDVVLRAGTTDDEFCDAINSKENLVFTHQSINRALQDKNALEFIEANGVPHADNPDLVDITIKSTGEVMTVRKSDVEEALGRAEESRQSHRIDAAMEIGSTMAKTGAALAVQQVVGLIVLETIDIFVDEIQDLTMNGRILNSEGLIDSTKERTARIRQRLTDRFEEKQIWSRAKVLGIESGVAGALNVLPQILIALLFKMPAFVLAIVRECTLSVVRCVRLMASNHPDKLNAIGVILAGSVTAIVGVYVSKVIGTLLSGVPLLNQFGPQIASIISGVIVVAVPLAAIYVFDQNKAKFTFMLSAVFSKGPDTGDSPQDDGEGEPTPAG